MVHDRILRHRDSVSPVRAAHGRVDYIGAVMTDATTQAYLKASGWPVTLKGAPKHIDDLTVPELRTIARKYAAIHAKEAATITTREAVLALQAAET
jgi:hypothetical protein